MVLNAPIGDNIAARLSAKHQENESWIDHINGLVVGTAEHCVRNAFPVAASGQPHTTIEKRVNTVELRHELNNDMRMTLTGQYNQGKSREYGNFVYPELFGVNPATPTVYPIFKLYLPGNIRESTMDKNSATWTQALGGNHELMVGVSYDRTNFDTSVSNTELIGELDLANANYGLS